MSLGVPCRVSTTMYVLPGCSNLQVGQKLCLPNTCSLYTVKSGDTCDAITVSQNRTLTQLLSWNAIVSQLEHQPHCWGWSLHFPARNCILGHCHPGRNRHQDRHLCYCNRDTTGSCSS
ncbi:hypothetical protein NLU13_7224 [Sarocladium strictum]|uniref:LysM domain-containing protein n=1 Tax=Sarocladium strictum TaxID=5046 RepID=A0AA39GCY9_SARSR|nr:hypothetical protein NLU13_7224 [Sarocladium strictum]